MRAEQATSRRRKLRRLSSLLPRALHIQGAGENNSEHSPPSDAQRRISSRSERFHTHSFARRSESYARATCNPRVVFKNIGPENLFHQRQITRPQKSGTMEGRHDVNKDAQSRLPNTRHFAEIAFVRLTSAKCETSAPYDACSVRTTKSTAAHAILKLQGEF